MDKMLSVQVKVGQVRKTPSFIGEIVAKVDYGSRVSVRDTKGAWVLIDAPEGPIEGWVHVSALTSKKVVLKAGDDAVETHVSGDELALAGKGFNKQVEDTFKAKNPRLDFTWIDKMETQVVSTAQMRRFLAEGKVYPEGGA
jgi:hypothetical protein